MTDREIITELRQRGWEVRTEDYLDAYWHQAFFRGFVTEWRSTLTEVLGDVQKNQEPEK